MSWQEIALDTAPVAITDGDRGKNYPTQSELLDSGYCLFLSATNVTKSGFAFEKCQFITEDKDNALRKGRVNRRDVVLTTRGTLGNVAYYSEDIPFDHVRINSGMVTIKADEVELLPRYLYFFLKSELFQSQVRALQSGAAQPQLPIRDIKKIKISYPDLTTQQRIADSVGAYDDLIENNRRRVGLLEEAARLIYREWFVHLRFPGHEHARITDGVPEAWEKLTYGDLFEFLGGFAFKSSTYREDARFGVVTIKNVHDAKFIPECPSRVDDIPAKMKAHCRLETGDVLLSLTGNVGRVSVVFGKDFLLNQRVAKVRGREGVSREFAYWTFSNPDTQKELENLSYGVAQLNLSPVKLSERPFVRPPQGLLDGFTQQTAPIFEQLVKLNLATQQLAKARDLLLPRLMDGRLEI